MQHSCDPVNVFLKKLWLPCFFLECCDDLWHLQLCNCACTANCHAFKASCSDHQGRQGLVKLSHLRSDHNSFTHISHMLYSPLLLPG